MSRLVCASWTPDLTVYQQSLRWVLLYSSVDQYNNVQKRWQVVRKRVTGCQGAGKDYITSLCLIWLNWKWCKPVMFSFWWILLLNMAFCLKRLSIFLFVCLSVHLSVIMCFSTCSFSVFLFFSLPLLFLSFFLFDYTFILPLWLFFLSFFFLCVANSLSLSELLMVRCNKKHFRSIFVSEKLMLCCCYYWFRPILQFHLIASFFCIALHVHATQNCRHSPRIQFTFQVLFEAILL